MSCCLKCIMPFFSFFSFFLTPLTVDTAAVECGYIFQVSHGPVYNRFKMVNLNFI
ncbi:hypothetical protein BO71DRAFT_88383 [Aspergillus ellipticus CBS 707.79]|uniref:Uncharacterized protein n=1 Tax=Aspergillus ellipticus CBS 707.79 TaxID=1448320 RepID=A0A319F0K4_9EURO|nr:hypothetical protein BO71DRAFT_88383 [Aspergillus ellipticus CBS 707.79]